MAPRQPRSLRNMTFGSRRNTSPGPPSPTFSDTTQASAMNFGAEGPQKIITRANLKASINAYEELMRTSANYRAALITMSKVSAAFADAMETCSGLKGPSYEAGTRLQAASGLHHLIGNHWHVLAEIVDKKFEKPLLQHLDTYRTIVSDRSASYERALREKSQIIRDTESQNMNRKERNLQSFRDALAVLQHQVDELDALKASHYHAIMEHEEEVWDVVQGKVCLVVRSTMDVFDRFTAKASDPVIEPMLQSIPDPFDAYGPPKTEDQIFSILPPLSIMTNAPSPSSSPLTSTPERRPYEVLPSKSTSWISNHNGRGSLPSESTEWAEVPSPSSSSPRSLSPSHSTHAVPPLASHHSRKAESKLRSVLSAIDESYARQNTEADPEAILSANSATSRAEAEPDVDWGSFTYGQSPFTHNDNDESRPRHISPTSPSPPLPPNVDAERHALDGNVPIPITT